VCPKVYPKGDLDSSVPQEASERKEEL